MTERSLKEIGDDFLKNGNHYPNSMKCPKCGETYFALFDKIFIDYMGYCYWPCAGNNPTADRAAENVLALVEEIL